MFNIFIYQYLNTFTIFLFTAMIRHKVFLDPKYFELTLNLKYTTTLHKSIQFKNMAQEKPS